MRFFVSLSLLLLLALSIGGLPPSRGCGGGTESCDAETIEVENSSINNTALGKRAVAVIKATNTAATSTKATAATVHIPVPVDRAQNMAWPWWCGTKPCGARLDEREDSGIHHTAVNVASVTNTSTTNVPKTNASVTSTTKQTPLSNPVGFFGWWCHTHTCRSRFEAVKKRQINNPNTGNGALGSPASPQASSGWTCGDKICPPRSEVMGKGQVNYTAMGNITTNGSASKNAGHPRIDPVVIWWCGTQVCHPSSMKAVEKRQVDHIASESMESS